MTLFPLVIFDRIWSPCEMHLFSLPQQQLQYQKSYQTNRLINHFSAFLLLTAHRIKTDEFYHLSHHENPARMRLKLEPSLQHDAHTAAANLRDNTAGSSDDRRMSHEISSTLAPAALNETLTEDEVGLDEELRSSAEPQQ